MIRAGFPATTTLSGTSFVTTLPAPTVTPLPMLTPWRTMQLPPNQQSSPTLIGLPSSGPRVPLRSSGSRGWPPLKKEQLGPISVRAPISMGHVSIQVLVWLTKVPLPNLSSENNESAKGHEFLVCRDGVLITSHCSHNRDGWDFRSTANPLKARRLPRQ